MLAYLLGSVIFHARRLLAVLIVGVWFPLLWRRLLLKPGHTPDRIIQLLYKMRRSWGVTMLVLLYFDVFHLLQCNLLNLPFQGDSSSAFLPPCGSLACFAAPGLKA